MIDFFGIGKREKKKEAAAEAMPIAERGELIQTEERGKFNVLSTRVGGYYLAPPDSTKSPYTPYVQTGNIVKAGEALCRIRAGGQDYVITAPMTGVVDRRIAEEKHLVKQSELETLEEGFGVGYHEPLFTLEEVEKSPEDGSTL